MNTIEPSYSTPIEPTYSTQRKRRSSLNTEQTKKKSLRACAPCRKRKVKCNGILPCDRCSKTDNDCIYDKPQKKKEAVKSGIEDHEPRLSHLKNVLSHLSIVLDTHHPDEPFYTHPDPVDFYIPHPLSIDTTGQGLYVPDTVLRTDRVPCVFKQGNIITDSVSDVSTEPIRVHLLQIYFKFVDPILPILHKSSFLQHIHTNNELLLNAMYCVSSRWDMETPTVGDAPRGWGYYQKSILLLDQQKEPKLTTIQALFLLLKYNEHVRRPGFMWRTRFYFQMMVRLCKDMGLQHDLSTSQISPSEIEKRKRIFWAVYCYDVMMSIENGTRPHFDTKDCLLDIPRVLSDETPEHGKIMQFVLLIQIMRNQADIVDFLLRRKGMGIEASAEYKRISNQLNTTVGMIQSSTKFPQKENMCYAVCFLYLSSCFATILLHRPYHLSVCVESALNIKRIIGLVLECDAFEDMYCSIRGLQQIVYYLSAAVTVFKECHREEDRAQTLLLTQRLASISPATEVIGRQMNVRPLLKDARHIASVKKANMEYEYMNLCDMNNQSLLDLLYYDERH